MCDHAPFEVARQCRREGFRTSEHQWESVPQMDVSRNLATVGVTPLELKISSFSRNWKYL
jgi:hypothetical protein